MHTEAEMMELIMSRAVNDDRIRAVAMDGSRANKNAVHDQYSDFDIVYFVTDVREFTKDKSWVKCFGEILIVQYPMDWYLQPYDYNSKDTFVYLIQFADGNRIDLSIVDISNIEKEKDNDEPRIILLNKDNYKELIPIENEEAFFIKPPTKMEFYNTTNEFRWLSVYISKGLCREEFYYAKYIFDVLIMKMFMKMLNWKIGIHYDFKVTTGGHNKYLKRYLTVEEMIRVQGIFPNGDYDDIWDKLFLMYDYFDELESEVAKHFNFVCNKEEKKRVRDFLVQRKLNRHASPIYISTERLYIRPFEEKDFQQFQTLLDLYPYWQIQKNNARQFFEWHLSNYNKMDIEHGYVCFGIFLKKSDVLIGNVGLNEHDDLHVPEMGFGILEDYRGKGYAKEASKAVLTWAKSYFDIPYLVGTAAVSNLASQKVLEYCGFELIGVKNLEVHCMKERYDFMTYRFDLKKGDVL